MKDFLIVVLSVILVCVGINHCNMSQFDKTANAQLGEECYIECAKPNVCINGTCRTKRKIGEFCDKNADCEDGLWCHIKSGYNTQCETP